MNEDTISTGIRLPARLHQDLMKAAGAHQPKERSLNAEIVARLTQSFAPANGRETQDLFRALRLPRAVRVACGNTSLDVENLLTICRRLPTAALIFAARADDLNNAVLVALIETPQLLCVFDQSYLNLAREPRMLEIESLFQQLDALGLVDSAMACTKLVPDTSNLPPDEAARVIAREGQPARMDLKRYLALLSRHGLVDVERFRAPRAAISR